MGTSDNAVVDVDVVAGELVITFADGSTESHTLPAAGVFGVDQTARDSAATAQTAADTAHTDIDDHEANHPSGGTVDQVARDAASDNADAIDGLPVPSDWAQEGNTDPVPDDKINPTIRGHRVFVQTTEPTEGEVGDTWIQDSTNIPLAIYERTTTSWLLDYTFRGVRVHYSATAHNVTINTPIADRNDLLLELVSGTLKLYRRNSSNTSPFWDALGTVEGGESVPVPGVLNVSDGRLPFNPVEMRIGWLQTPTTPVNAATFDPACHGRHYRANADTRLPARLPGPEPTPCQFSDMGGD